MARIGGSIQSVSIGGRLFTVAADAEANRDLGGFTSDIESNGDGTARKIMTRKPWEIGGLTLSLDDANSDQEYVQSIADSQSLATMSVTFANGETYEGQGTVAGDFKASSKNTTGEVTLKGEGVLTRQV